MIFNVGLAIVAGVGARGNVDRSVSFLAAISAYSLQNEYLSAARCLFIFMPICLLGLSREQKSEQKK